MRHTTAANSKGEGQYGAGTRARERARGGSAGRSGMGRGQCGRVARGGHVDGLFVSLLSRGCSKPGTIT